MDQNAFIHLVQPFQDKLFRLAKRLLVSREEAEDAAQEVMVRLWAKKKELPNYSSVEALAMTMTKNYCLDQLKAKRSANLRIEEKNQFAEPVSLEKQIDDRDQLREVESWIAQLPEQQRLVLQLREIEQMEFEEIAQIMELSEANVRVSLSRARKFLREQLNTK